MRKEVGAILQYWDFSKQRHLNKDNLSKVRTLLKRKLTGNLLRYNFPFTELQTYIFKQINAILICSKQLYSVALQLQSGSQFSPHFWKGLLGGLGLKLSFLMLRFQISELKFNIIS